MAEPEIALVWLKRDLRLEDHAPLARAIETRLPLIIAFWKEPEVLSLPENCARHQQFIDQSLKEMDLRLAAHDQRIMVFREPVLTTLDRLREHFQVRFIFSHEETGQDLTYSRDKAVAQFCRKHGIEWLEFQNNGVKRGMKNRDDWSRQWHAHMNAPLETPEWQAATASLDRLFPEKADLFPEKYSGDPKKEDSVFQKGGPAQGWKYLHSFLQDRARNYGAHISKPGPSRASCSRISPYLSWGNLSMRQVWQAYRETKDQVSHKRQLSAFRSRLAWHCHFIQKFEMEPRYEKENLNRGFDIIRTESDPGKIRAWETGMTGIPLVDASMRCVNATGYLNFRMRAMLVSFFTHHLFQPWQAGTAHLARQFLDYEPGIHFCQFQMQAGTTGTNTFRIYNPVKQAQDHDPEGKFICKWVPELANLPAQYALEPWKMGPLEETFYQFKPGRDYPAPIVDLAEAARNARNALYGVMKTDLARSEKQRILQKHVNSKARRTTVKK